LTSDDATVANVLQRIGDADIFQFSGHAISAASDAALVLKPVNGDKLLWVSRLPPESFRNLRIAVLAACSTGRPAGEARYPGSDMARALLLAGVPVVIASAWDVDSRATTLLIESFYDHLRQGALPESAVAESIARVRSTEEFAHPYYWAAFALYRR
jgi:CHAT domain-containing protein